MTKFAFITLNDGTKAQAVVPVDINGDPISGGSNYIDGEVATFANLPDATLYSGQFWLVQTATGIYLINRKSSGLYYSNGTAWVAAPDIIPFFSDANIKIVNDVDDTKEILFDASPITAGNARTITMADRDVDLNSPTFDDVTATTFSGDLNGTINTLTTGTTQVPGDNSTKIATTAYVDTAITATDTWDEVMHNGSIFTVADNENLSATITQNDITNNPSALIINNTGTGNDITAPNFTLINGVLAATTFSGALTGNASTATAIETARTIGGVSFDGTANITVESATGGFTVSGGALALGANNITMSGSIGITGTRVLKGWFTDLEVTNAISGSITGNAATATALETPRTIAGGSFDGTANIDIDHDNTTGKDLANTGITYGHIDDQSQSIYGLKTFEDINITGLSGNIITSESVELSIEEIDAAVYDLIETGFTSWGGAGAYYSVAGTTFSLLRAGSGRIKGKAITWLGSQDVELIANACNYIYIDNTGTIAVTQTDGLSLYTDNIVLFEALYDGTNVSVVKENHPCEMQVTASYVFHTTIGTVITSSTNNQNIGANITRVATGTGGAAADRQLKIVGEALLQDHGLTTTITDSAGVAIIINWYYTNGAGHWTRYAQQSEALMVYNNAGTITAITANRFANARIYVSKDDLNSSTPTYYGVIGAAQYLNATQAQVAINNNTVASYTNELYEIELAQLGFITVLNSGGGYISKVTISKKTAVSGITTGSGSSIASGVNTDVTLFDKLLSVADSTSQAAFNTIDEYAVDKRVPFFPYQGDPTNETTGAISLTLAKILTGIITGTPSAARAYTLDTGTNMDAGGDFAIDSSFDWTLQNNSTGADSDIITLTADTGHTIIGSPFIYPYRAINFYNCTARFRTRKTASNTFITYRTS